MPKQNAIKKSFLIQQDLNLNLQTITLFRLFELVFQKTDLHRKKPLFQQWQIWEAWKHYLSYFYTFRAENILFISIPFCSPHHFHFSCRLLLRPSGKPTLDAKKLCLKAVSCLLGMGLKSVPCVLNQKASFSSRVCREEGVWDINNVKCFVKLCRWDL